MKNYAKLLLLPLVAMAITGCEKKNKEQEPEQQVVEPTVSLDQASVTIVINGTKTLVATTANGEGGVTWSSDKEGIATVSSEGVVTAVGVGTATITATYSGKTATCTVNVVASEHYRLAGVQVNEHIRDFLSNVADEDDEFRGQTSDVLEVGDDNAVELKPILKILNKETLEYVSDDDVETVWNFDYSYKLELLNEGSYSEASADYVESFNNRTCKLDFDSSAIGKEFRVTIIPGGLSESQRNNPENVETIKVKVYDGWNVYTANELAYFDDVTPSPTYNAMQKEWKYNRTQRTEAWVQFRQDHGLDTQYVASGIFLQSDIVITKDNLPGLFFFKDRDDADGDEGAVGKMKDCTDCYIHEAENFVFSGNYFNIDTSAIPLGSYSQMWNQSDGVSHSTLFKVAEARNGKVVTGVTETNLSFKNCSYFGNSQRSTDDSKAQGLIFYKVRNGDGDLCDNPIIVKSVFDNFNVTNAVISFYVEYSQTETTFKDCVVSEDYANAVMVHLNADLNFVNSKFENMGGPVIVTTCGEDTQKGIHIVADEATEFNNFIGGNEAWFVATGAYMAMPQFAAWDPDFLGASGKTYVRESDSLMNMILANRGKTNLVQFTKGTAKTTGLDRDTTGYQTILDTVEAYNAPFVMLDNGSSQQYIGSAFGEHFADDLEETEDEVTTVYKARYLNALWYYPGFDHVGAIFEIFNKA